MEKFIHPEAVELYSPIKRGEISIQPKEWFYVLFTILK